MGQADNVMSVIGAGNVLNAMDAHVMGLLQRSFYGGVLILVIIALRILLLDKLPKRTFPILWCVALARLLAPFSFSSIFSVYSVLQKGRSMAAADFVPQPGQGFVSDAVLSGAVPETAVTGNVPAWEAAQHLVLAGEAPVASGGHPFPVLPVIWCAGLVFSVVFFAASYLRCIRGFRTAVPVEGSWIRKWQRRHRTWRRVSVRQTDQISAPLTYGVFRPIILLSGRLLWENRPELKYVLQHEYVHICHYDAAVKLVMVAVLCVHWFNPLVWIMSGLLNRDIELACDEGVLRRFGEQSRAGYAMALIGMEEKKRVLMPLYNGFSKNVIEERINSIMKYKKTTYAAITAALMLVLSVVLVFATSAKCAEASGNPSEDAGAGMENERMDPPKGSAYAADADSPEGGRGSVVPDSAGEEGGNGTSAGLERFGSSASYRVEDGEYTLAYMAEDMPAEESAYLISGKGYCLLLPKEGWRDCAPDAWMWEYNELVQVWVNDCGTSTWEEAVADLEENGYSRTDEDGILRKESDGRVFFAEVRRSRADTKCVNYTYPADPEYEEWFGRLLAAVAMNFAILPESGDGVLSEDGALVQELALGFWEACLVGDAEALKQYLAADYSGSLDVFPDGADRHAAEGVKVQAVKGLDIGDRNVGDVCEISVEFKPAAEADSYEYLTIEVVKEQDGWKVLFYGFEM